MYQEGNSWPMKYRFFSYDTKMFEPTLFAVYVIVEHLTKQAVLLLRNF
jgi:hypothetical protein